VLVPVKDGTLTLLDTTRLWRLELQCGHSAWRKPHYTPLPEGQTRRKRSADEAQPHPKRVHCTECRNLFFRHCDGRRREGKNPLRSAVWLEGHLREVRG
jgi:hypothetical protein